MLSKRKHVYKENFQSFQVPFYKNPNGFWLTHQKTSKSSLGHKHTSTLSQQVDMRISKYVTITFLCLLGQLDTQGNHDTLRDSQILDLSLPSQRQALAFLEMESRGSL